MGRKNRTTVKTHHRMQRPKWLREREEQAYRRIMDDFAAPETTYVTWERGQR